MNTCSQEWLSKIAEEEGKPTSWMFIQNEGGTQPAVRKGVEWVQSALKELENTPRVEMSVKDLVIGAECGGSDYTSRSGWQCGRGPVLRLAHRSGRHGHL